MLRSGGTGVGYWEAEAVIEGLGASRGLFRARELDGTGVCRAWLTVLEEFSQVKHVSFGVWSHPRYTPTRYEVVQLRTPAAVLWGPSALWVQGFLEQEPERLWLAIDDHARAPRHLDACTTVVRSRRADDAVVVVQPLRTALPLRVQDPAHAAGASRRRLRRKTLQAAERSELATALEGLRATPLSDEQRAQRARSPTLPMPRRKTFPGGYWLELLKASGRAP